MGDPVFDKLSVQIGETKEVITTWQHTLNATEKLILENQLIIMEVLEKMDDHRFRIST